MKNKEEINRTIGIRLAALCSTFRVPPAEMAETLGVSVSQFNRYLSGKTGLTAAQLVAAAKRIGVTTAVITEEERFGEASR